MMNSKRHQYTAVILLISASLTLAVSTNLAKFAQGTGLTPLAYLVWSLAGASLILTVISRVRAKTPPWNKRTTEYFVVAGFLSTAATNLIFFSAVNQLGVSFIALMMALPPLLTYIGALLLRMEEFCHWRALGVTSALAGTVFLVINKWSSADSDPVLIVIAMLGPVLLAMGNLYRTQRWPPGASAESLAPGMLWSATLMLIAFSFLSGWPLKLPIENTLTLPLLAVQATVFAAQFLLLFALQKRSGPVFLSLMGGVSAIFGVPIAMILLNEPVLPAFFISALFVAAGIACMLYGEHRKLFRVPA